MQSSVVGFDESGCYCNKRLDWAWIAQTVYFTLVFHGNSRKGRELEDRFGDSLERVTAVTDRHSAYFALHFLNHQVCLAHLLRECQYLNELDKGQQWSDRWKASFRKRYVNGIRSRRSRLTLSHGLTALTISLMKIYQGSTKSLPLSRTAC